MLTNPWSMQKYSLRDNQVLFHMARQKHTIKIKCKGHPLINESKKVDFQGKYMKNTLEFAANGHISVLLFST
jgi:hypothetical protein